MRPPDLYSKDGRIKAWRIEQTQAHIDAHIREFGHPPAGIDSWYLTGPFHPFWHWWHFAVVSLKDIPGIPPANKQYPEAEYEFAIWSLKGDVNIDACDRADLENRGFDFLHPADVTFHFHNVTDEQAREICHSAVSAVVNGHLSPDSDFRETWKKALATTVSHYVLGVHE